MKIKDNLYGPESFETTISLEEIISQNEKKILNLIYGMTGDYHLAQDLTQETFIKAFQGMQAFNGKSKISTWLYRIAVNLTIDYQRKSYVKKEDASELNTMEAACQTDNEDTDKKCQKNAIKEILYSTISKLPEQQKEVFILKEINGCTNKEIAEILGCSVELVKWRLHKARIYLRKEFEKIDRIKDIGILKLNQFGLE